MKIIALLLLLALPIYGSGGSSTGGGGGGGGGLDSINGDTTADQIIASGTSGNDFAVSSSGGTTTIKLPAASATAAGKVTTGAQVWAGQKTLSSAPICSALTASQLIATDGSKAFTSIAYASANTASAVVQRDGSGNFSAGTITGSLTGNASTATALAANPTDCSAGQYANAIAASGNLTCADPLSGLVGELTGFIEAGSDKTYVLDQKAAFAYTINLLDIATASGTATAAVKINGTNVTGISAVSVSSTPATGTASAANSVAAGDKVTLVLSSSSTPVDMAFTLKFTR